MTRSVDTILREAWIEIKKDHDIALTDVTFNLFDSSAINTVDRVLLETYIEGVALIK